MGSCRLVRWGLLETLQLRLERCTRSILSSEVVTRAVGPQSFVSVIQRRHLLRLKAAHVSSAQSGRLNYRYPTYPTTTAPPPFALSGSIMHLLTRTSGLPISLPGVRFHFSFRLNSGSKTSACQ